MLVDAIFTHVPTGETVHTRLKRAGAETAEKLAWWSVTQARQTCRVRRLSSNPRDLRIEKVTLR